MLVSSRESDGYRRLVLIGCVPRFPLDNVEGWKSRPLYYWVSDVGGGFILVYGDLILGRNAYGWL